MIARCTVEMPVITPQRGIGGPSARVACGGLPARGSDDEPCLGSPMATARRRERIEGGAVATIAQDGAAGALR